MLSARKVSHEHAVVDVVDFLSKAASVKNASAVLTSGTVAVTDKGIDLAADDAVLAAAERFFAHFRTGLWAALT
jgi:hypothetical protein